MRKVGDPRRADQPWAGGNATRNSLVPSAPITASADTSFANCRTTTAACRARQSAAAPDRSNAAWLNLADQFLLHRELDQPRSMPDRHAEE